MRGNQFPRTTQVLQYGVLPPVSGHRGTSDRHPPGRAQSARHGLSVSRPYEMAVHQPSGTPGRLGGQRRGTPLEQRLRVEGDARRGEFGQRGHQAGHAVFGRDVERDGGVRPVAQDPADQSGQHPARARLHKGPHPGGVHRLDLLGEAHRFGELSGQQLPYAHRLGGIGTRRGVRPDRKRGPGHGRGGEFRRQRVGGARDDFAVKGTGDRDALGRDPRVTQRADRGIDRMRGP